MSVFRMNLLTTAAPDFDVRLGGLLAWDEHVAESVHERVQEIIAGIRSEGDAALLEFTRRFDGHSAASVDALEISGQRMNAARTGLSPECAEALNVAAERIRAYAEHQKMES